MDEVVEANKKKRDSSPSQQESKALLRIDGTLFRRRLGNFVDSMPRCKEGCVAGQTTMTF
jgi:hypothetical protein